ncbi:MAG TPA: hypothetical protein VF984_05765 [Actinomycetota bacterium]
MPTGDDGFEELAGPNERGPDPETSGDLASEIARAMGAPRDRVAVRPEDEEMAWLELDGLRLSWFNLRTASRMSADRRSRLVEAFAELARRIDRLRPMMEPLEVGRRYRVEYRNQQLRRNMRVKGVLRGVTEFRPAKGVNGAGWVLTLETKPAIGTPATFRLETTTLVDIRPA